MTCPLSGRHLKVIKVVKLHCNVYNRNASQNADIEFRSTLLRPTVTLRFLLQMIMVVKKGMVWSSFHDIAEVGQKSKKAFNRIAISSQ